MTNQFKPSTTKMINQINHRDTDLALRRLGRHQVSGAIAAFGRELFAAGVTSTANLDSKDLQIDSLKTAIEAGTLTLAQIQTATPVVTASAGSVDDKALASVTAVAIRADSLALSASTQSLAALKRIDGLCDTVTSLESSIQRLHHAPKSEVVDKSAVATAVAQAVADAVVPFKRAIESDPAVGDRLMSVAPAWVVEKKPVLDVFGVDVRTVRGDALEVEIWNHSEAPAIDPNFIWTADILRHLIASQNFGENAWFGGEKGKSETARQFAAKTGRAFVRINFEKYTAKEDYLGATGLVDGETVFQPQAFLSAFETPSTVILLDELSNADPANLAPLNGFLEPHSAVSFGGAVRTRAEGVLIFAADNTLTNGDESGRYAGTRTMNSALADRFSRVIEFKFLPIEQEIQALINHTECSEVLARHVIEVITVARGKVQTADLVDAPSIRSAIAFIRALEVLSVEEAWITTVVNRQPSESHSTLMSLYAACINTTLINTQLGA